MWENFSGNKQADFDKGSHDNLISSHSIFHQFHLCSAIWSNENCGSSYLIANKKHAKRRGIFKWAKSGKSSFGPLGRRPIKTTVDTT